MSTPRQTVTVTHHFAYDEATTAEIAALEARLAEPAPRQRMSQKAPSVEDQLAELRGKVAANVVRITFQALPRREYRDLLAAHPARPGDDIDARAGYNTDTFGDALLRAAITATTDLDGNPVPNEWDTWADDMSDGAWRGMFRLVLGLQKAGNPNLPL